MRHLCGLSRILLAAGVVLVLAGSVLAQAAPEGRLDVVAPGVATAPPRGVGLEPGMPPEQRGTRDQEFYPGQVRSRHEPAFVHGLSATVPVSATRSVRLGLSGWTAPAVPFDIPQAAGGAALGLTVRWDEPTAEEPAPAGGPAAVR